MLPNARPLIVQKFSRLVSIRDALKAVLADFSDDGGRGEMSQQTSISPLPNTKKEKKSEICRELNSCKPRVPTTQQAQAALLAGKELSEMIAPHSEGVIAWTTANMVSSRNGGAWSGKSAGCVDKLSAAILR